MPRPVAPMKWWQWLVLLALLVPMAFVGILLARLAVGFDREPSVALQVVCAAVPVALVLAAAFGVRRLSPNTGRTLRYRILPVGYALLAALYLRDVLVARTNHARWWAAIGIAFALVCVAALLLEARKKRREAA